MIDAIYTPPDLARSIVEGSSLSSPRTVADFAAGDGALLRAAAERWPKARLFGFDIDRRAVSSLRSSELGCDAARHDFLGKNGDGPLTNRLFDLILLNPPFSNRGNKRYSAEFDGTTHYASKALAFVARALRFLRPHGELIAILPASVLTSERDSLLLKNITDRNMVSQIGNIRKYAFKSRAVMVTVLRISRSVSSLDKKMDEPKHGPFQPFAVEMTRGSLPVHSFFQAKAGMRFIHTTHMRERSLLSSKMRTLQRRRHVQGPVVLISRVGRPSKDKVVLMRDGKAVISDCVIALRTVPSGHELDLAKTIERNWETFQGAYGGSCAPYTTLRRLREMFLKLGILSSVPGAEPTDISKVDEEMTLPRSTSRSKKRASSG